MEAGAEADVIIIIIIIIVEVDAFDQSMLHCHSKPLRSYTQNSRLANMDFYIFLFQLLSIYMFLFISLQYVSHLPPLRRPLPTAPSPRDEVIKVYLFALLYLDVTLRI